MWATIFSGLNEVGEKSTLRVKGWNARIAQHEMDHINGVLYTDIMDRKSFQNDVWSKINYRFGKVELRFYEDK